MQKKKICGIELTDTQYNKLKTHKPVYLGNHLTAIVPITINNVTMEQKFTKAQINWAELEQKHGLTQKMVEDAGMMDTLLKGWRSDSLIEIKVFNGKEFEPRKAALKFKEQDGKVVLIPYYHRNAPELDKPYRGFEFTQEDKTNLYLSSHLGRIAQINIGGKTENVFISIDKLTNEIRHCAVSNVKMPVAVCKSELDQKQISQLMSGAPAFVKDMKSEKKPDGFANYVQISAITRRPEFANKASGQYKSPDEIKALNGIQFTTEMREALKGDKELWIEGMKSQVSSYYAAYISWKDKIDYRFPENLAHGPNGEIVLPKILNGVHLDDKQREGLAAGDCVKVENMIFNGVPRTSFAYICPEKLTIKLTDYPEKVEKTLKGESEKYKFITLPTIPVAENEKKKGLTVKDKLEKPKTKKKSGLKVS